MRFTPITAAEVDGHLLESEYKTARQLGKLRLGELHLYFKSGLKIYYIPYRDVHRCFRRVMSVPARLCCGRGDLEIENLVICGENDRELAQIQLPGAKAARILMQELEEKMPFAAFGRPPRPEAEPNP